jgi:heme-degrading monooxygenase HmoA
LGKEMIMIVKVFIRRKLRQESAMDAFQLLKKLRHNAMNRRGYISGETLVSANDDCELIVISTWHKMEDWISWKKSEERKTIDAQLEELQEGPTIYEPFVFSKYRLAAKAGFPEPL